MPLYITVDNRFEAKPAEENYKSNVMYAKYSGNNLLIQSHVKLKKKLNITTLAGINLLENRSRSN